MNNIGGIVKVELLPTVSIERVAYADFGVRVTAEDEQAWKLLPIAVKRTTATAIPKKGTSGTLYAHSVKVVIPQNKMNQLLRTFLTLYCPLGVIARVTDANGGVNVYGTHEYPLTGTLEQSAGGGASALAGFTVSLSASALQPQLHYIGRV